MLYTSSTATNDKITLNTIVNVKKIDEPTVEEIIKTQNDVFELIESRW